jgi:hypothetical protein
MRIMKELKLEFPKTKKELLNDILDCIAIFGISYLLLILL